MRIFGSDRIKKMMMALGLKEDEPIEHRHISNAIANAQKKVEAHNFDIRKHLLDYDNIMNEQRKTVYAIRKLIIGESENISLIEEFRHDLVDYLLIRIKPDNKALVEVDFNVLNKTMSNLFKMNYVYSLEECSKTYNSDLKHYLSEITATYLKEKISKYSDSVVSSTLREIMLSILDQHWKNHLQSMDHLKEGINLRSYGQKDPLLEYKRDGFHLFESMRHQIKEKIITTIYSVQMYTEEEVEEMRRLHQEKLEAQLEAHRQLENEIKRKEELLVMQTANSGKSPLRSQLKVGRNDPCPCGSGKKFKACHGVE
jgi:preprotein translocase subunit SecA